MIIHLHEIDGAQETLVKKRLSEQGQVLILVHPFHFGWSDEERAQVLEQIRDKAPFWLPVQDEIFLASQEPYVDRLHLVLNSGFFSARLGFVFETTAHLHHVAHLLSMNPEFLWVVIPTGPENPEPIHASWSETFDAMVRLGVKDPYVGGCYCIVAGERRLVPPDKLYSCVNDVFFNMANSGRFPTVNMAWPATYQARLPAGG